MDQQVPSLYPNDQIRNDPYYPNRIDFNVNEIKKYQFPDCIKSYFEYFETWTPRLTNDERKILLNRLLQDDDIAFSIYMENVNEPYEILRAKLIEQFSECDERFFKDRKEKKHKKKMFKKMSREEMQDYIRTTYNNLNTLSKERLVMREVARSLPRKFRKLDLENKCSSVDQMVEMLGEKLSSMKLKDREASASGEHSSKRKVKKHFRLRRHRRSSSSSSSSDSSDDEKGKKKAGHGHDGHKKFGERRF